MSLISGCEISLNDKRPIVLAGCESYQPICLSNDAISKLERIDKVEIAIHNKTWATQCNKGQPPCKKD